MYSDIDSVQFYASNGFPCPTLYNPSDHYLRIINKDFEQVYMQTPSLNSVYLKALGALDVYVLYTTV
jgi:hypothetical protein